MYVMRKSDYAISAGNDSVLKKGKHVEVTLEQASFVLKNPAVNGPKVALHIVNTAGFDKSVESAAFKEMLRREEENQRKGDEAFVPQKEEAAPEPEQAAGAETAAENLADMRKSLEAIPDKDTIIAKAVSTFGMKAEEFDKRWGKDRVIDAIMAKFAAKQ